MWIQDQPDLQSKFYICRWLRSLLDQIQNEKGSHSSSLRMTDGLLLFCVHLDMEEPSPHTGTAASAFPLKHSVNAKEGFSLDFRSSDTGCEPMVSWEGGCFCIETFLPDFLHLRKAQPNGWQGCPPSSSQWSSFLESHPLQQFSKCLLPVQCMLQLGILKTVTKFLLKAEFYNFCPTRFLLALQMWGGRAPKDLFWAVLTRQSVVSQEKDSFPNMPWPMDPLCPVRFSACVLECVVHLLSESLNSPYLIFMTSCYGVQVGLARDYLLASASQMLRI